MSTLGFNLTLGISLKTVTRRLIQCGLMMIWLHHIRIQLNGLNKCKMDFKTGFKADLDITLFLVIFHLEMWIFCKLRHVN